MSWMLPVGCAPGEFACIDDGQCGVSGVCEPEGWCSFPDVECPDGRRFGAHAGDGLGGTCVPARDDTGSSSSTGIATTTTAVTSLDATTLMSSSDAETSSTAMGSTGAPESSTGTPTDESSTGDLDDPDLLVWLDFDDAVAPWADHSGYGNDASCSECPVLEAGMVGNAARFDGLAQHLVIESSPALEMPTAFTIAAWVHADTLTGIEYRDVVTRPYGDMFYNSWALGFPPELATMRFVIHDGMAQLVGGDATWPMRLGWHHVAGTWDGAASTLYLDGVAIGANMIAAVGYDEHPVLVGADLELGAPVNFFAGMIDDVRIYSRALGEDEIAALASG